MSSPPDHALDWSETGARAVDLTRALAEADGGAPEAILIATGSEEWFAEQDASYQEEVLPRAIRARACVGAGIGPGWRAFAACQTLYEEFGITAQRVALAARTSLARLSTAASPTTARGGSHEFPA